MFVEIGTEAAQFLFGEYINGTSLAVWEGDIPTAQVLLDSTSK
jgi:hypothetical protein